MTDSTELIEFFKPQLSPHKAYLELLSALFEPTKELSKK
jgi:hypothetical protein